MAVLRRVWPMLLILALLAGAAAGELLWKPNWASPSVPAPCSTGCGQGCYATDSHTCSPCA